MPYRTCKKHYIDCDMPCPVCAIAKLKASLTQSEGRHDASVNSLLRMKQELEIASNELEAEIAELKAGRDAAYYKGLEEGIRRFTWWKDGVRYVGTCGTTFKAAIEEVHREKP